MANQSLFQIVEEISIDLQTVIPLEVIVKLKEYIADKCDSVRETLMREEFLRRKYIDDAFYQVVDCNEITCLTKSCVINGVSVEANTDIYQATISPLITGLMYKEIKFLSDQLFNHMFTRSDFPSFVDYKLQYVPDGPIYTIIGNQVYLKNLPTEGMKVFTYAGLHVKPSTVCNWKDTDSYPVTSTYKLKVLVKQDILSTYNVVQPQKQPEKNENQEDKDTS